MSETLVFGNLGKIGVEVVKTDGHLFLCYDAGSHQVAWRKDEITEKEFEGIIESEKRRNDTFFEIQKRLISEGIDPYKSNWKPE